MNWKLHLLLKAELEKYGIEVITTRASQDKDLALESRGKASKGSNLFISLHSNAASSESTNYVVVMHQVDDNCGPMDEQSRVWYGIEPTHTETRTSTVNGQTVTEEVEVPNPHNYKVVRKARSLNHLLFYLKEVDVS